MTWGTRWTLASNAALITLALPVCSAFMAFIFLHEKMTLVRWLCFAFAIAADDNHWGGPAEKTGAGMNHHI